MGKRSRNSTRRVPAQFATVVSGVLRALSICVPVAGLDVPAALAQQLAPAALMADIPAQPLGEALAVFAKQTGLQLVYVSGVVDGQRSRALRAGLKPEAAFGAGREGWTVQVYGENLTDTRVQLFANYSEYVKAVTVNRPRTIGVRMSYKFSGG
jgi:hypothetical protein